MKKFKLMCLTFFIIYNINALAQDATLSAEDYQKIFETNLQQTKTTKTSSKNFSLSPAFGVVLLDDITIDNAYYDLDLKDQINTTNEFSIGGNYHFNIWGPFDLTPGIRCGYSYNQDIVTVENKRGQKYRDVLQVTRIPFEANSSLVFNIPRVSFISLEVGGKLFSQYLSVQGELDGLSQSTWISGFGYNGGLNLFKQDRTKASAWFGGLQMLYGIESSFSKVNMWKASKASLALNFLM